MSTGLIALLDDIAALTKLAAASLDDAAGQAAKASSKAIGIVIDDTAVTPRYVVGLAADRELPIVRRIAMGSLKNKLLFLLPGALALSYLAPWLITPLLMLGGAYLCYEGYHKVQDLAQSAAHGKNNAEAAAEVLSLSPPELEDERVASAIRTDFILSAEIMAIALGTITSSPIWMQALILAAVGVAMTIGVYGVVGLIVKADDAGVALARSSNSLLRTFGRGLVKGMPVSLNVLSFVGMLAMLWVGGGIIVHGLQVLGEGRPESLIHHAAESVGSLIPVAAGVVSWLVQATISGVLGLLIGALCAPLAHHLIESTLITEVGGSHC